MGATDAPTKFYVHVELTSGGEMETEEQVRTDRGRDVAESILHNIDRVTTQTTRTSIFHVLSLVSIGASLALWFNGRKMEAIFVGLWPPTFEALKSASERD